MKLTTNQKWLLGGAVVLGAIILIRRNRRVNEDKSSASGTMHCMCRNKWGGYSTNTCRKSQHADCESCCSHYGKVSDNEGSRMGLGIGVPRNRKALANTQRRR